MNACQRNDDLVRSMAKEYSLSEIARTVGTNKRHVKKYILDNNIPHKEWTTENHGADNGRWKGGEIVDKDGYILVKKRDHPNCNRHGYVRKHRLVMEKHLGRYLKRSEVVHHKDGDKKNNRIENLGLFSRNSDHLKHELTGRVPKWTKDGKRRILEGIQKSVKNRQAASRAKSKHNGS